MGQEIESEMGSRVVSFRRSGQERRDKLSELRALLKEKGFSGGIDKSAAAELWPTGLAAIDAVSGGGFPAGGISEVVARSPSCGSSLLMRGLLQSARRDRRYVGLVDGRDSFDPGSAGEELLPFLLWVRCVKAAQAMQAIDLLARDGNLSLLLLDLRENVPAELRRQPPGVWHRLQRVAEKTGVTVIAVTAFPLVNSARLRFELRRPLTLDAFGEARERLLPELAVEQTRGREAS